MRRRTKEILGTLAAALATTPATAGACTQYRAEQVSVPADARYRTGEGHIRIVGYNDMAEMLTLMAALFTRRHPEHKFDLILHGTRTAPPALTEGTSLLAPMGAEWEAPALAAYRARYGDEPAAFRVAHDSLNPQAKSSPTAVIVHSGNGLRVLDMDRVRSIFAGATTHWSQLPDSQRGAIHPVGFAPTTAIGQFLLTAHMQGQSFAAAYDGKAQSRDVVEAVAADPQAIGLANLNHADDRVRVVGLRADSRHRYSFGSKADIRAGRYPLDRHLLVYARRDGSGRVEPLAREWLKLMLSCEGQAIIARGSLGYIPLSDREARLEISKLHHAGPEHVPAKQFEG